MYSIRTNLRNVQFLVKYFPIVARLDQSNLIYKSYSNESNETRNYGILLRNLFSSIFKIKF